MKNLNPIPVIRTEIKETPTLEQLNILVEGKKEETISLLSSDIFEMFMKNLLSMELNDTETLVSINEKGDFLRGRISFNRDVRKIVENMTLLSRK